MATSSRFLAVLLAMLAMAARASAFAAPAAQRNVMRAAMPVAHAIPSAIRMAAKPKLSGAIGKNAAASKGGIGNRKPAKSVTELNLIDLINPVNPYSWAIWFIVWINAVAYFK